MTDALEICKRFQANPNYNIVNDVTSLLHEAADPAESFLGFLIEADKLANKKLIKDSLKLFQNLRLQDLVRDAAVTREVQERAFSTVFDWEPQKQKSAAKKRKLFRLFPSFVQIFEFNDLSQPLDVYVKKLIKDGDYVSAAVIQAYGDHNVDDPNEGFQDILQELIIPLFIIDRCKVGNGKLTVGGGQHDDLIKHLLRRTHNTKRFVDFLDWCLVADDADKTEIVVSFNHMPKNATSAFDSAKKTLKDMIKANKYRKEDFPNFIRTQAVDDLHYRYIMWKRGEMSKEQFEAHATTAMEQGEEWLQKLYVRRLLSEKNYDEASKWAVCNDQFHKLRQKGPPYDKLNIKIYEKRKNLLKDNKKRFALTYKLDSYIIRLVETDSVAKINEMTRIINDVPANAVVTMDCENRATYLSSQERIALFQFAILGESAEVFILDGHSLYDDHGDRSEEMRAAWEEFFKAFFSTSKHRIFGLGLWDDIRYINSTFPRFRSTPKKRLINSEDLIRCLQKEFQNHEILNTINKNVGLKDLYKSVVPASQPIDKSQQMSCFDQRPLSRDQMDYAARDVIVLQSIFAELKRLLSTEENGPERFEKCVRQSERTA